TERNVPPPLLVELKPVDGTLADLEQRSYWVEVTTAREVIFEAAGRDLADLRLWTNGEWLVDATPSTQAVTPEVRPPLSVRRLSPKLAPGFYLLAASGGAPQAGAKDSREHPFHLRFGIPRFGEADRRRHTISAFGIDRYLVPGSTNYFRVEVPEARPV